MGSHLRQTQGRACGPFVASPSNPVAPTERLIDNAPTPTPLFTGRERELQDLHTALQTPNDPNAPLPVALYGMGGVGKTQTAAQYVRLYKSEYALVAWIRGDTPADFTAQLAALAPSLGLPVPAQPDQQATFEAVRQWFAAHGGWLLVVDNAEDLFDLAPLLPSHPKGRVLLTTRERAAPDVATSLEILYMDDQTGATLLLRAAGLLQSKQTLDDVDAQTQADAQAVSVELGGLALALHQAGAYMYPLRMPPATYLRYYRERRQALHKDYKSRDHASVTVTFDLALEQVQAIPTYGPAAVALARLCAFLAPDAIPDEVFLAAPDALPAPLAAFARSEPDFAAVCEAVTRYALLRRVADPPGLSMHRLAQETARDGLDAEAQKAAAEQITQAVNRAFPSPDFAAWTPCERLLPHAFVCARHITGYEIRASYAARLLTHAGGYLRERGRYAEAEPFLVGALEIRRKVDGEDSREVSTALNNLGLLYNFMHRVDEAADCLGKAHAIDNQTPHTEDAADASHLDNLAQVLYLQAGAAQTAELRDKKLAEAATLREKALRSEIRANGPMHPDVALRLHNLANVYADLRRYAEAEARLKEARDIALHTVGEHDPGYADILVALATVYIDTNHPADAEPLLRQALAVYKAAYDPMHPEIANCCYWLGGALVRQGRIAESADQFQRAWEIRQKVFGPQSQDTITALDNLNEARRRLSMQGASQA